VSRTPIYLDHNATAPLHPAAREAMCAAFDLCGNASSIHAEGRAARALIEAARDEVAAFAGVAPKGVVFTSGGTEALNLALTPHVETGGEKSKPFDLLLAGAGEHPAVLAGHRFAPAQLELAGLTPLGVLDLDALGEALSRAQAAGRSVMLALQAANNETGVIQPVSEAAGIIHAAGGLLVCDAVQAAGKIPCDLGNLGADALVFSAHKFGGPKGAGALCFGSDSYHKNQRHAPARRRPRTGVARGNRKHRRHCRNGRCPRGREGPAWGARHGPVTLAGRDGDGNRTRCPWRGVFWRQGGKIAEYILLCSAFHRGASVAYCFGYGGFCGIVGFSLFVGEGETVARLERDGCRAGAGNGRHQG